MRPDFDSGYGIHQGPFRPDHFGIMKEKVGYEER